MSDQTHSRAGALRRIGLLLGGAGLGAAGGFAARGEAGGKAQSGNKTQAVTRVRLRAAQLVYSDPDATPTSVVRVPSRLIAAATLIDEAGLTKGSFTGVVLPAGEGGFGAHTLTLDGGTLMGMGPAAASGSRSSAAQVRLLVPAAATRWSTVRLLPAAMAPPTSSSTSRTRERPWH